MMSFLTMPGQAHDILGLFFLASEMKELMLVLNLAFLEITLTLEPHWISRIELNLAWSKMELMLILN